MESKGEGKRPEKKNLNVICIQFDDEKSLKIYDRMLYAWILNIWLKCVEEAHGLVSWIVKDPTQYGFVLH